MKTLYRWAGLFCAAAGCSVGPDYKAPETQAPDTWSESTSAGPATRPSKPTTRPADVADWWRSLNDPALDSLIERAANTNLDLRMATARVREARALRGVVAADLWPQINVSAAYDYRGSSLNAGPKPAGEPGLVDQAKNTAINSTVRSLMDTRQAPTGAEVGGAVFKQLVTNAVNRRLEGNGGTVSRDQNLFQLGFDASWELDVFGGIRRAIEAADADLVAAEEGRRDVLVTLLSEVALNYVQLRGSQRRLAIARDNILAQRDTLELTQTRHQAGFTSELDVAQARAQLATTESQVPLLEDAIRQAIYQLSVLLAQPPAALLPELEKEGPIPVVPVEVPIGLPSDLLRRRSDIRAVERQLAAATARIGVATADLFPRFSLTGSFGPQTRDLRHIFDRNSLGWSVGPQISWPILDGWRIRSNIEVQDALQEQALAAYEKTVLTAFQEVEVALVAYANAQVRHRSLTEAVAANQQSTDLSKELYSHEMTNFLNVLVSQRALYASQDELVQNETSVITNLIALYKALGGGWQTLER